MWVQEAVVAARSLEAAVRSARAICRTPVEADSGMQIGDETEAGAGAGVGAVVAAMQHAAPHAQAHSHAAAAEGAKLSTATAAGLRSPAPTLTPLFSTDEQRRAARSITDVLGRLIHTHQNAL